MKPLHWLNTESVVKSDMSCEVIDIIASILMFLMFNHVILLQDVKTVWDILTKIMCI